MRIDLYSRSWNDAHMLPFFFRHYDSWVNRYIIYDDGSQDETIKILQSHPRVEVRAQPQPIDPSSRVESSRQLQNEIWKESRNQADWVIVTDLDEHLYHPRIHSYLERCADDDITVVPALGFEMISDKPFPRNSITSLFNLLSVGAPSRHYSKASIFNPNEITESNFTVGRHEAMFEGQVVIPRSLELLLLHFHYIDFARVASRHALYLTRQLPRDLSNKWGIQYTWSEVELRKKWEEITRSSFDIRRTNWTRESHSGQSKWQHFPSRV